MRDCVSDQRDMRLHLRAIRSGPDIAMHTSTGFICIHQTLRGVRSQRPDIANAQRDLASPTGEGISDHRKGYWCLIFVIFHKMRWELSQIQHCCMLLTSFCNTYYSGFSNATGMDTANAGSVKSLSRHDTAYSLVLKDTYAIRTKLMDGKLTPIFFQLPIKKSSLSMKLGKYRFRVTCGLQ
jgi:hypothetical protein